MAYDPQTAYAKYLKKKCSSGCGESSCKDQECTCCPAGLVAVYDENGKHIACLTPNDAQEYTDATMKCQPGYVKLYKNSPTEVFIGCVSESEFVTLYQTVNPA